MLINPRSAEMSYSCEDMNLESFDDLFVGQPLDVEKNLTDLLPQAQALENKSIYLQILSQIALAQAMQKKFAEAHKTLDIAEAGLTSKHYLARVRILLERGRVFHQSDNIQAALPLFKKSYSLSKKHKFDFHTVNAAHMIAIVEKDVYEKIKWNQIALDLAQNTEDKRPSAWLGVLYNNLGQNYIEAGKFKEALFSFKHCKKYGEDRGDLIVIRGAKWGIGRALRSLGSLDEALKIQLSLLKGYDDISKKGELPIELVFVGRGILYEELAEIHQAYMKKYAAFAYQDLLKDSWCIKLMPERLEKMKQLSTLD